MFNRYAPRPEDLPTNPVDYIPRLAYDLASGIHNRIWRPQIRIELDRFTEKPWSMNSLKNNDTLRTYLNHWGDKLPDLSLLETYGYIQSIRVEDSGLYLFLMTEKGLRLPEQNPSVPIFISYARSQSSALALLLVARFKERNMSPFLDMHPDREDLPLSSDWEAQIELAIQNSNTLIVLIGPKTLTSDNVRKELEWAVKYKKKIIPLWHMIKQRTQYASGLSHDLKTLTDKTQGVIVEAENPKQYNAALDQLLAHFNIAP